MSALRQLLGAIWAAVWLRGRLLGLKLRRLVGGEAEVGAGPDPHLIGADVLVDEVEREPLDLPAELLARLDIARAELVDSARDAVARGPIESRSARRRRTASIAVAALLGLGVAGAGASALVSGSTGVPAVDRLLGLYETGLEKPTASERPGPFGSDLQPAPSKASDPIEVTLADGSRVVASFFEARDGKICSAAADARGAEPGTLDCEIPAEVIGNLTRSGGYASALETKASQVLVKGYTGADVASLSGRGPNGSLDVHLGRPWTPSVPGAEPLRPFVAVGPLGSLPQGLTVAPALELDAYAFRAVTEDGRTVDFGP